MSAWHRKDGWARRWHLATWTVTCWAGLALSAQAAEAAPSTLRQPGSAYMSRALQALQNDDSQNPGQLWVQEGEALWNRPAANGERCASCHTPASMRRVASRYPAFDARGDRPLTLAGRIDQCRQQHLALPSQSADGPEVLALNAWLAHQSRGEPVTPSDDPRMETWLARGDTLWRQRMGQLNLSCAQCHDQRAGQRLGGAAIVQAHPTGYPAYRLEWQSLGSLERRLRGCMTGVRAEPFPPSSDDWTALEIYLMRRAAGMAMEGVSVRP